MAAFCPPVSIRALVAQQQKAQTIQDAPRWPVRRRAYRVTSAPPAMGSPVLLGGLLACAAAMISPLAAPIRQMQSRGGLAYASASAAEQPSPNRPFFPVADEVPYLHPGPEGSVRNAVRELMREVGEYKSASDMRTVFDAFVLALRLHRGQMRSSGDPYITHPIEVAMMLAQSRMDVASVVTGLLHDTVEDTGATSEYIEAKAGAEVARIVDGVTKLSRMEMAAVLQQRDQQRRSRKASSSRYRGRSRERGGGRGRGGGGSGASSRGGGGVNGVSDSDSSVVGDSSSSSSSSSEDATARAAALAHAQSDSENLRKLVLALSTDIRVLLVKLTDRLHNMRTLHYITSRESRRRKAHETLNIYAPLADRLGMARLCHELETLSFRELYPEEHAEIVAEQQRRCHSSELQEMLEGMRALLAPLSPEEAEAEEERKQRWGECAIFSSDDECWAGQQQRAGGGGEEEEEEEQQQEAEEEDQGGAGGGQTGGEKSSGGVARGGVGVAMSVRRRRWALPAGEGDGALLHALHVEELSTYRIWRRGVKSGRTPSEMLLKDFFTCVLVTPSLPACYHALGAVHGSYRCTGEMRDYISTPKPNHYASLHTTVLGPRQQMARVVIRTKEMHTLADLGVVSLWQDASREEPWRDAREYHSGWISSLLGISETAECADEFMELTRMELYPDEVFCLTPKGLTIRLPRGGTPLDFAYAIHTRVGNTCSGAKVNGRAARLNEPLRSGDLVEVMTDAQTQPSRKWERMAVTGKARAEIRRHLNAQRRSSREAEGRQLLARALDDSGIAASVSDAEVLAAARAVLEGVMFDGSKAGGGRAKIQRRRGTDGSGGGNDGSADRSGDGGGGDGGGGDGGGANGGAGEAAAAAAASGGGENAGGGSGALAATVLAASRLQSVVDVYPCIASGQVPLRKVMAILRRECQGGKAAPREQPPEPSEPSSVDIGQRANASSAPREPCQADRAHDP